MSKDDFDLRKNKEKFKKTIGALGNIFEKAVEDINEEFSKKDLEDFDNDSDKKSYESYEEDAPKGSKPKGDFLDDLLDGADKFFTKADKKFKEFSKSMSSDFITPNVTDEAYIANLVIAGVEKEDLNLRLEGRELILSVEKTDIPSEIRKNWSFSKKYAILSMEGVSDADLTNIKSSFKNGIFTITVPRIKVSNTSSSGTQNINID